MKLTIKTLQGKPLELEIDESNTVLELKLKIAEVLKVEPEFQKIIHFGKVLQENTKKISECGIKDKEFLVLMLTKVKKCCSVLQKPPEKKEETEPKIVPEVKPAPPVKKAEPSIPPIAPTQVNPPSTVPPSVVPPVPAPSTSIPSTAPKVSGRAEESYLVGGEYETAVASLMEMGFSRDEVVRAMSAAFNNPERATDYLLNVL